MKANKRMRLSAAIVATLLLAGVGSRAVAATYGGSVSILQTNSSDCFYFKLEGVEQVDPPTIQGWFAVPLTAEGAKNILAVLLSARVTGMPITVATTGSVVCGGYAQATHVSI